LEDNCFFAITDGDFWESSGGCIIRELDESHQNPGNEPSQTDKPSPALQEISYKSLSSSFVIVLPKNHTNQSESYTSSYCHHDGDGYECEKNSHAHP